MNKEEERQKHQILIKELNKSATAVFLACDEKIANDISAKMNNASLAIGRLINEIDELKEVMLEASDYLDTNKHTSIGSGSILHSKFRQLAE